MADMTELSPAARDVIAERHRQINVEGFTPERDDVQHAQGNMLKAAMCYVMSVSAALTHASKARVPLDPAFYRRMSGLWPATAWPWDASWWKPKSPRQDLVRAAALIIAEIERLDRAEARKEG